MKDVKRDGLFSMDIFKKFLSINKDWEVIGFAFNPMMYSDIYIRKFR